MAHVDVYDADVPDKPPADARGRVYPYVVLWPPSPGGNPFDPALAEDSGGLTWTMQVTVAAGDVTWCMQTVTKVRDVLTGVQLAAGASRLTDGTPTSRTVMRDPDVTPHRWFVPLIFDCQIA